MTSDRIAYLPVPFRFVGDVIAYLDELAAKEPHPTDRGTDAVRFGSRYHSDRGIRLTAGQAARSIEVGRIAGTWTCEDLARLAIETEETPMARLLDVIAKEAPRFVSAPALAERTHLSAAGLRAQLATITKHSNEILGEKGRPYVLRKVEKVSRYRMPSELADWWLDLRRALTSSKGPYASSSPASWG